MSELGAFPWYLFQGTAVVGLISIFLMFRRNSPRVSWNPHKFGIVLGLVNFLIVIVLAQWIQGESKPYIRNDILFLAGFFGGWIGAAWTLFFTLLGRFLFGGDSHLFIGFFDISFVAVGAVWARFILKRINIEFASNFDIFKIILIKSLVTCLPLVFIYLFEFISGQFFTSIIIRRLYVNFSISVFIIYAVIFLFKHEIMREKWFYFDPLTLLPNRRLLKKDIDDSFALAKTSKEKSPQTLVLIGIDNFAELVQENSDEWMDKYLQSLSAALTGLTKNEIWSEYQPLLYSFSDSSIVMVLKGINMAKMREISLAESLQRAFLMQKDELKSSLEARLSIKVIDVELGESFSPSWFLRTINVMGQDLYAPINYFESNITLQIQMENRLRLQIEEWIEDGAAPVWFQPKVHLADAQCIGAEALLRVKDPNGESYYVPPHYVLSIAKKYHLLVDFELAIIKTAIRAIRMLPEEYKKIKIAVNVSAELLNDLNFHLQVIDFLSKAEVAGDRLILEITETSKLASSSIVKNNIENLVNKNINISLDDFGTGYSSISILMTFPFNEIKLDYSLIYNYENPRVSAAILMSVDGAKRYSARLVAEGITSEVQRQKIMEMGIEYGQGFLFAKAMPYEVFLGYLKDNHTLYLLQESVASSAQP